MNTDNIGAGPLDLLGRRRANNGVTAVNCGRNTAPQGWGHALVARHRGPRRIPQVTRHEEVLIGVRAWKGWHRRHQGGRGLWRGAIGDAWNVGDLNDVGGPGENGGGDGLGGLASISGGIEGAVVLLLLRIAALANDKIPDEAKDHRQSDHTSDDSTSDCTDIGSTGWGRGIGGRGHTFRGRAAVARLRGHGTGLAIRAGGTGRDRVACYATLEEGARGSEAIYGMGNNVSK